MVWLACCLAAFATALALPDPSGRRSLGRLWPGGRLAAVRTGRAGTPRWLRLGRLVRAQTQGLRSARALATDRREAVIDLCDALAAELRAGKAPRQALEVVAATGQSPGQAHPLARELGPVLAASRLDADVAAALRSVRGLGTGGLTQVAAAWEVAENNGAALADLLDRIARSLRADTSLRREVTAQLAAPRATARLLVGLPLFGLVMGSVTGMDPLTVLVTTPYGWACLVAGVVLAGVGVWWVERLAASAECYAGGEG